MQCSSCLADQKNICVLACSQGHAFCEECIKTWIRICQEKKAPVVKKGETFFLNCALMQTQEGKPWCGLPIVALESLLQSSGFVDSAALLKSFVDHWNITEQVAAPDEKLIQQILDVANVHCPGCEQVLDVMLDGCCATRHEACGTRFFWICLDWGFATSEDAHSHVRELHGGNVFLDQARIDAALQYRQLRQIQKFALRFPRPVLQGLAANVRVRETLSEKCIGVLEGTERFSAHPFPFAFRNGNPIAQAVPLGLFPPEVNEVHLVDPLPPPPPFRWNDMIFWGMDLLRGDPVDWDQRVAVLLAHCTQERLFGWMTTMLVSLSRFVFGYRANIWPIVMLLSLFLYGVLLQCLFLAIWVLLPYRLMKPRKSPFSRQYIGALLNWLLMTLNVMLLIRISASVDVLLFH